jgi:hypothetical protein
MQKRVEYFSIIEVIKSRRMRWKRRACVVQRNFLEASSEATLGTQLCRGENCIRIHLISFLSCLRVGSFGLLYVAWEGLEKCS